jgi:Protein of unknown function (DUF1573)
MTHALSFAKLSEYENLKLLEISIMKFYRVISVMALVLLLALIATAGQKQQPPSPSGAEASVGPAPMMVIDSMTHDFGEVKAGTPLRYAFKVKNQGTSDLLINSVSPG